MKVPSLAEKVEDGSLNLSQLTRVQKCVKVQLQRTGKELSSTETLQILEQIENKNAFETEKTLAVAFDIPIQAHESLKPQKDESVRVEFNLSKEQFAELEQARSLLSHICPEGNWSDVVGYLAQNFNRKKLQGRSIQNSNPIPSPEQNIGSSPTQSFAVKQVEAKSKRCREYISIHTQRFLLKKAAHCCEYHNPTTGIRCRSKYQLQIEHIYPWSLGGSNSPENLKILCRTHNNLNARKVGLS